MLQGPQPSNKTRRKPVATRTRAQTDYQKKKASNNTLQQQPKKAQDDLLDLFGSFAANDDIKENDDANPFGDDPFAGFVPFEPDSNASNTSTTNVNAETPKKKKKKKKKNKGRTRAQTVATTKSSSPSDKKKEESPKKNEHAAETKSNVKLKKIDVLPLLHQGIRCNKFKLNGNKSKVRTFYLTDSNFYFCWEAVGALKEKKSLFGGKKGTSNSREKRDKDRSSMYVCVCVCTCSLSAISQ